MQEDGDKRKKRMGGRIRTERGRGGEEEEEERRGRRVAGIADEHFRSLSRVHAPCCENNRK